MSAKPKSADDSGDERCDLFIAEHQEEYSKAISLAREAAATTATIAWQTNYAANVDTNRKMVANRLSIIETHCETIKAAGTSEDLEKGIRDAVKALSEERIRFFAWQLRAVFPYSERVSACKAIAARAIRLAEEKEANGPLYQHGLANEVRRRIDAWPRASWDERAGVVEVKEAGEI